jgi:hypothetical protein
LSFSNESSLAGEAQPATRAEHQPDAPPVPAGRRRGGSAWIQPDSIAWPIAVSLAFTLVVLLLTPIHIALSWDESVYASQIGHHVLLPWGPHRARGLPLLIAPVQLLNGSALALRIYLTVLAGVGLFLAQLAWRGLKPAWVLALAALVFGGLGMVQSQASLVFPNYWIALGGLTAVGLFFQGWLRPDAPRRIFVLLAVATAFTALMRPQDGVVLAVPLLVVAAGSLLRRPVPRNSVKLLIALVAGLAVGCGEWLIESYMYFGGPVARLAGTAKNVGGTRFDPLQNLRIIDGGATAFVKGWVDPRLLLWWLVFAVIAVLGIYATGRTRGWVFALVPVVCALGIYTLYSFPIRDNARYLLPAWALLALPVADGIAWLAGRSASRSAGQPAGPARFVWAGLAVLFVAAGLVTQHTVLTSESAGLEAASRLEVNTVSSLRGLGINGDCMITSVHAPYFVPSSGPSAYYLDCSDTRRLTRASGAGDRRVVILVQPPGQPPAYASAWPAHKLAGTGGVVAYIEPPR